MQITKKPTVVLFASLLFIYGMQLFTFKNETIFWYLYTFTLLICMAVSILSIRFYDELATWKYLIYGIGYGTITYFIIKFGYFVIDLTNLKILSSVRKFLELYGPSNIWHYTILILIIVAGEEMFWRGFVQQQLKRYVKPYVAVSITAILFSLSIAISGFKLGALAAIVVGLIWGALYEWKKSLPLVIVAHIVFILLLFLILPIA